MLAPQITAEAKLDDGRPARALSRVISLRCRDLGETLRDATIATAINVLKSLRADTRVASDKSTMITVVEAQGVTSAFYSKGGSKRRCVRIGGSKGPRVSGRKIVYLVGRRLPDVDEHVYFVRDRSKSGTRNEDYYIVAFEKTSAVEYAKKRREKRMKRYKGLAKRALGVAMARTSSRNAPTDHVSGPANKVALRQIRTMINDIDGRGSTISWQLNDMLDYAKQALRGGEGSVATAMARAANKTVGIINANLKRRNINRKIDVPFPEIVKRH